MKNGIQLHEQGALKNLSTLTSNFIEYTKSNQRAADLLQQNGFELVQILLKVRLNMVLYNMLIEF